MSAIWGMVSFDGNISSDIDEKMRLPYTQNCKIDKYRSIMHNNVYIGCGIQYITKEAENEILPIENSAGTTIFTADCILDNRDTLIKELLVSSDISDGSLMYLSYMKWGMDCLTHFEGLFSMAVYDTIQNKLYLAADRTACRCLYYYKEQNMLAFSSLIAPILHSVSGIKINELYIKDFLTAPGLMPNVVYNETPYQNMYKLTPGCYLEISKDSLKKHQYWNPYMDKSKIKASNPKEYGEIFMQTYDQCVKSALRTSGQIAISLSSGLDSSSVGALAAKVLAKEHKTLHTYTYIPIKDLAELARNTDIVNEKNDVLDLVNMYQNMIPHFTTNYGKNCYQEISKVLQILEMPFKSMVNSPSLMEIYENAADCNCKVVLSGQSGNSTVSYGYIDDILYDLFINHRYVKFLKYLNHFSTTIKESRKTALKNCIGYFRLTSKTYRSLNVFDYTPQNTFLSSCILDDYPMKERYMNAGVKRFKIYPTPKNMYGDYLYNKSALCYLGEIETKMGLSYGIILRDPTRDSRIITFCSKLPYHLFAYKGIPRWLICGNFHNILPEKYLNQYLRYGVQNIDWFYRICRDWKSIYPEVQDCLNAESIQEYINNNKTSEYLKQICPNLKIEDENNTEQLFFICICSYFLQHAKE